MCRPVFLLCFFLFFFITKEDENVHEKMYYSVLCLDASADKCFRDFSHYAIWFENVRFFFLFCSSHYELTMERDWSPHHAGKLFQYLSNELSNFFAPLYTSIAWEQKRSFFFFFFSIGKIINSLIEFIILFFLKNFVPKWFKTKE